MIFQHTDSFPACAAKDTEVVPAADPKRMVATQRQVICDQIVAPKATKLCLAEYADIWHVTTHIAGTPASMASVSIGQGLNPFPG